MPFVRKADGKTEGRSTPGYQEREYKVPRYECVHNHSKFKHFEGKLSADPEEYYEQLWKEIEDEEHP